jgi:hypothetical protein
VNIESVSALLSANWSFLDLIQLRGGRNYAHDILDSLIFKKPQQYAYVAAINKLYIQKPF